ncbi:MAG: hypothetical protein D4R43_01140 [Sphingobacteriales bacterium]|nr:MAG: hypothetical protein D4R43_01140 [Sphingobacteriales bacterium]
MYLFFPSKFIFQLYKEEFKVLISQFVISKTKGRGGTQKLLYAFTELGISMLSSVLRSKQAIDIMCFDNPYILFGQLELLGEEKQLE